MREVKLYLEMQNRAQYTVRGETVAKSAGKSLKSFISSTSVKEKAPAQLDIFSVPA